MPQTERIYLDNAATSWPKPESVYQAVERYMRELGAAVGRGVYAEAAEVDQAVREARRAAARFLGAENPRQVIFTANGTDALNLAIHGLLRAGDHVVTSVVEHNSVLRPLRELEQSGVIQVTRVACDAEGVVSASAISDALRDETRLIALVHASNVTGALQPIEEVGRLARQRGILFLVDAAQTAGHVPIDVGASNIDLLAAPGHKGLLGPLGTGLLCLQPGVEEHLASVRQGGTGSASEQDRQPESLPDKYESGNHNAPAILGLAAGLKYLEQEGVDTIRRRDQMLTAKLLAGLGAIEGVRVHGPRDAERQVGVVSITLDGYDPQEVAALLDSAYRIQVRPGLQCAPLMHRALGTLEQGGTVRFSVGAFTTDGHVDAATAAVAEIAAARLAT